MEMNGFIHAAAVTPSDSANLPNAALALFVGTGGTVSVLTAGGETVTFGNVPSGTTVLIKCTKVLASNTAASNIVALWN